MNPDEVCWTRDYIVTMCKRSGKYLVYFDATKNAWYGVHKGWRKRHYSDVTEDAIWTRMARDTGLMNTFNT